MTIHVLKADEAKRFAQKLVQPFVDDVKQKLQAVLTSTERDRRERKDAEIKYRSALKEQQGLKDQTEKGIEKMREVQAKQNSLRGDLRVLVQRLDQLSGLLNEIEKRVRRWQASSAESSRVAEQASVGFEMLAKRVKDAEATVEENKNQIERNRVVVDRVLKREVDLDNQRIIAKGESDES